jgi:LAS superfamily LD-carboxypeptidase LdcB
MGNGVNVSLTLWLGFRDITYLKMGSHNGSTLSTFVAGQAARNEAKNKVQVERHSIDQTGPVVVAVSLSAD